MASGDVRGMKFEVQVVLGIHLSQLAWLQAN